MDYFKKNLLAFWLFTKLKIKRVFAFKANVISQGVGMFINNFAFLGIWWLLMRRFGSINGYTFNEIILIQGFTSMFYAWFFFFLAGVMKLAEYLNQDHFLDLQIYPVSPLTVLITKSGAASQLGDFFQGGLLLVLYSVLNPGRELWILLGIILIVAGLFGIILTLNSLLFFFPRVLDSFTDIVHNIYIGAAMYPSQNFEGGMKYFLYFILLIPIISFPVEVTRGFLNPYYLVYTVIAIVVANILGLYVWQKGVRRVESGSGGGVVE